MSHRSGWTRRTFLQRAALSLPALAAFPGFAAAREQAAPAPAPTPLRPGGPPRKVAVVGAGLAGLAAAWELQQAGHEVTVLEAQNRAGGRVYTLRSPFSDGMYADAGAVSMTDNPITRRYIDAFQLTTEPFRMNRRAGVFHLRGKRLEVTPGQPPEWPYDLTPEEKKAGFGLIPKLFGAAAEMDPFDPALDLAALQKYDAVTLADYLASQGASSEAIALLGSGVFFGYGWSTGSALHRLLSDAALFFHSKGGGALTIPGGMDQLTGAFAKALRERIYYGAPVTRIVQETDKVRVVFRQGGAEQTLEADRLICAAPVPALRNIEFTPALPAAKRQIFDQLEYTPVTRVYLQTRRRFWEDAGRGGGAYTDLPIQTVSEQPFAQSVLQGPRGVLESHMKGDQAARIAALDPDARIAFAIENIEKVQPGLRQYVEGGTSYSWGDNPWAGGGYAWWKPGQLTKWVPELAKAEGRIHFAGDQTSAISRTVEGALMSGARAAREVAG